VKKTQIPVTPTVLLVEALAVQVMPAGVLNVVVMDLPVAMAAVRATAAVTEALAVDTGVATPVDTAVVMAADTAVVTDTAVDTVANAAATVVATAEVVAVMARVRLRTPGSRFQLTSTWCANASGG